MQFTIIGLGNPGEEHEKSRHNIGQFFTNEIFKEYKFDDWELNKRANALITKGLIEKKNIILALPQVFMNKSGLVVGKLAGARKKKYTNIIVIHDDIDLPIGKFKVSFGRGSAGHKGVESVFRNLGNKNLFRIRIGVSPAGKRSGNTIAKKVQKGERVIKHVLGDFKKDELQTLKKIYPKIDIAIKEILNGKRSIPKV